VGEEVQRSCCSYGLHQHGKLEEQVHISLQFVAKLSLPQQHHPPLKRYTSSSRPLSYLSLFNHKFSGYFLSLTYLIFSVCNWLKKIDSCVYIN